MPDAAKHAALPTPARATAIIVFGIVAVVAGFALQLAGADTVLARTPSPSPTLVAPDATAPPAPDPDRGVATQTDPLVRFGDDATLPAGETAEAVFVFGGDADVAGTVRTSVVVIGGDAIIRATADIGSGLNRRDAAIVVVGGTVDESPYARVKGTTQVVSLTAPRINVGGAAWHLLTKREVTALSWFRQTIFGIIVGLVVVLLFPRPLRAVRDRAFTAPLAALGWGSLTAFMTGVVALILAATIIGLVIVVPALLVSPFVALFIYAAAAFAIGDVLLARIWTDQKNAYLSAVTGVVVLGLVGLIPLVGGLANMAVWLIGLGAAAVALVDWRRARQARSVAPPTDAPAGGPGGSGNESTSAGTDG